MDERFSSLFNRLDIDILQSNNLMENNTHSYGNQIEDNISRVLDIDISIEEDRKAIWRAKLGQANGFDNIPVGILRNNCSVSFLRILLNICFVKQYPQIGEK